MATETLQATTRVDQPPSDVSGASAQEAAGRIGRRWQETLLSELGAQVDVQIQAAQTVDPETAKELLQATTEIYSATANDALVVVGFNDDAENPFLAEKLESPDRGRLQPLANTFVQAVREEVRSHGTDAGSGEVERIEIAALNLSDPYVAVTTRLGTAEQQLECVQFLPLGLVAQLTAQAQSVPPPETVEVEEAEFAPLPNEAQPGGTTPRNLEMLYGLKLDVTVELGRTRMPIREILGLGKGAIVELQALPGDPVDILVNGRKFAEGEVVVVDEHFGVRVTHLITPDERARKVEETT